MFQRKLYHLTDETAGFTASSGSTTPVRPAAREQHEGTVQVTIGVAATVQVEGSLDGTNWVPLGDPLTASGGYVVAGMIAYRLTIADNTGVIRGAILI